MEETNYYRKPSALASNTTEIPSPPPIKAIEPDEKDPRTMIDQDTPSLEQGHSISSSTKTYLQKLALFQKADLEQPNRLYGMMTRPLIFLTFPVIFYAGFSYGSNLVVSPTPNATLQKRQILKQQTISSGSTSLTAQLHSSSVANLTTSPPPW